MWKWASGSVCRLHECPAMAWRQAADPVWSFTIQILSRHNIARMAFPARDVVNRNAPAQRCGNSMSAPDKQIEIQVLRPRGQGGQNDCNFNAQKHIVNPHTCILKGAVVQTLCLQIEFLIVYTHSTMVRLVFKSIRKW